MELAVSKVRTFANLDTHKIELVHKRTVLRLQRVRVRGRRGGRWARGVGVLAGVLGAARAQAVRGRQPSEGAAAWGEAGVVVERRAGL